MESMHADTEERGRACTKSEELCAKRVGGEYFVLDADLRHCIYEKTLATLLDVFVSMVVLGISQSGIRRKSVHERLMYKPFPHFS